MPESTPRFLAIPPIGWRQVAVLLEQPPEKWAALRSIVDSMDSLEEGESLSARVAEDLSVSIAEAVAVLNAAINLRETRAHLQLSDDELLSDLEAGVGKIPDQKEGLLALLAKTASEVERDEMLEKSTRLGRALLPWLQGARTICDLRPVFNADRTEVRSMLTSVLVGVTVHDPTDHLDESFVFQTTREGLAILRAAIDQAENKLRILEEAMSGTFPIE